MVKLKRTNQKRQIEKAKKLDEVSHDLISIFSKPKWIKLSMAVCFISLNKKGDPQGKGPPYQEVEKIV